MARNNDFEVQMSILQNQETRLKAAMASAAPLQAWSLSGIRLPELQYDYRTFFAFAQIGYDYCYLHESRNGSMPWWQGFGPAHGIVVIPSLSSTCGNAQVRRPSSQRQATNLTISAAQAASSPSRPMPST